MYAKQIPATFTPVSLTFETREEFQTAIEFFVFGRDSLRINAYSSFCGKMIDALDAA